MTVEYYLKKFRGGSVGTTTLTATTGTSVLALTACSGGSGGSGTQVKGFPSSYVAPSSNFVAPTEDDPNFELLNPVYNEPYWVASLEMDQWNSHVTPMLENFERVKYLKDVVLFTG